MPGGRRLHLFDAQCVQRLNQHHLPGHRLGDWRLYERRPTHNTDPFRVDCDDASVPHRQQATQILKDLDSPSASTSAPAAWATSTLSDGSRCASRMSPAARGAEAG